MRRLIAVALLCAATSCARADRASSPTPTLSPAATATATPSPTPARTQDPFALARRYESSTPEQAAERLETVELALDAGMPISPDQARMQQAAYRQLVRMATWRARVYALVDPAVTATIRANVEAGDELRKLTAPRDQLPPWHIVAPPPASELLSHYRAARAEFGIDWTYLAAIHLVETRMGRIRGDSIAGAKGPMQFLPQTWAAYGKGDINDPRDAIRAAARYLRAHGAPSDMRRALFAYNHSDHYVRAIELYAARMRQKPNAYDAYHAWEVYYRMVDRDALLYVGWRLR